jgi:glycosyltransferase involved in cell wall biosynthesis
MNVLKNKIQLSIVVPCFNESANVNNNIEKAILIAKKLPIEFIFVNNDSSDNTQDLFNNLKNTLPKKIKLISVEKNNGYGFGIKSGIIICKGDFIGWTHGDAQTDIMDIVPAYETLKINPTAGIIKGKRIKRQFKNSFISNCLSLFVSLIFFKKIYEINAQPSIYNKKYLVNHLRYSNDFLFDFDALINARMLGAKECRIKVKFLKRKNGSSSWETNFMSKILMMKKFICHIFFIRININILNK